MAHDSFGFAPTVPGGSAINHDAATINHDAASLTATVVA
jgi:hypothetical protein